MCINSVKLIENSHNVSSLTLQNYTVTCDGNSTRIFINGQLIVTTNAYTITNNNVLRIADAPDSINRRNNCKIRSLRITKGICRYINTFIPPNYPYPEK